MDSRRLSTADVIARGILDKTAPESGCPRDAALVGVDEEDMSRETLRAGLQQGGLSASMYYGCWSIWKTPSGFSGELFQYHAITDSFADVPMDTALDKAREWDYPVTDDRRIPKSQNQIPTLCKR